MSIRTILFDLDGTLIDTNELIIASFIHTFKQYGREYTRAELKEFNGPPLKDTFASIDPNKVEEMVETYRAHNFLHHDAYVKPFPHVIETLIELKNKQIQIGIVSTKMQKGVLKGLQVCGLEKMFDAIVTLDDVTNAKPNPEPVLKGMELLAGQPESTLMVGDNYHDIEAGHRAGVQTAGVSWSHKGKEFLQSYHPTYMLEDMRDLLRIIEVR
ncbi:MULTISPECIES: pyrophosphatase PpaX [unclassified Virgibacillus]|uniref:pyrophosphatase PpaX n=1 Tax=unclassified Virgibacillus TaxID=2620237 RepID=UPI0024DE0510|nr:pyrophosphatase PpaX [Virgibacillus sp. LDC-1]